MSEEVIKKEAVIEKDELLTRNYISLVLVVFVVLVFFVGLLKGLLFSVGIAVAKYLFDKYVMIYVNPYIDKLLNLLKSKL